MLIGGDVGLRRKKLKRWRANSISIVFSLEVPVK
jgi:hypothetical protein